MYLCIQALFLFIFYVDGCGKTDIGGHPDFERGGEYCVFGKAPGARL